VDNAPTGAAPAPDAVGLAEAARVWLRIGCLGFGGPAGQIALMHAELVERRRWISEARFLHALNYCMLLPGPEAQQLAIYIGWLMHGTAGGVIAGVLFVLPGAAIVLALSALYAAYGSLPAMSALFFGLKAAVLALVVQALLRIARRALQEHALRAIAVVAFVAIHALHVPFPLVVLGAALVGLAGQRLWPRGVASPSSVVPLDGGDCLVDRYIAQGRQVATPRSAVRSMRVLATWGTLWLAPVLAVGVICGRNSVYAQLGTFFSGAAVVTFGGAYAVLAYVAQRAVDSYGWLGAGEMIDGLALAETTPGPLILVLQFVGYIAAYRAPGELPPLAAGLIGALLTSWVTFVPSFLWILLGAPHLEALRGNRHVQAALSAITAAVVGVILNLTLWFALRTLFGEVDSASLGPFAIDFPRWRSVQPAALVLTLAALLATFRYRLGVAWTLPGCAVLGLGWGALD